MANATLPEPLQASDALLDLFARGEPGRDGARHASALALPAALVERTRSQAAEHGRLPDTVYLGAWILALSRWTGAAAPALTEWPRGLRRAIDCGSTLATGAWLAALDASRMAASGTLNEARMPIHAWGLAPQGDGHGRTPPLLIGLDNADTPRLWLDREAGLVDDATAAELLEAVAAITEHLSDAPAWRTLGDIASLSTRQRAQQLSDWNRPTPPCDATRTVVSLFDAQVAARPDAIALARGDEALSYRALEARASRLATRVQAAGAAPGATVGVLLDHSMASVVALLAVLKAGAAYLPLQAGLPHEQLAFRMHDAGARLLLGPEGWPHPLPAGVSLLHTGDAEAAAPSPTPVALDGHSLACVLYTAGTTGVPKGTEILHRAILAVGPGDLGFQPGAVVLHAALPGMDVSAAEIWGPLLNGGCCVVHDEVQPTARGLARTIAGHGVSAAFLPGTVFNRLIDDDPASLRGLRQLFVGGEALSVPHVRRALEALPALQFVHAYGSAECTAIALSYTAPARLPADTASLPIGHPIADTTAYITGPTLDLLPAGLVGELCLGGRGVARGYIGRPTLTAERFVADPFAAEGRLYRTGDRARLRPDGGIEFRGRQQDPEAAIEPPRAVAAPPAPPRQQQQQPRPSSSSSLQSTRPLLQPEQAQLAQLWASAIGLDVNDIHSGDNFFALGGHSVLAMRVIQQAEELLGLRTEPSRYLSETLAQLAVHPRHAAAQTPVRRLLARLRALPFWKR
ncbi:non-ribosomal peptide synthetase [Variovorax sp. J2P1-31]|uniref:non-ribosomal peptide synthetase n=1 Tax=Variovorax sp. J2P1-31 TaxID=3053497 RepID=UPI002578A74F|nr:non-ribosomal peptide synthetase [Variovorax sp. J2P1-31]MDM0146237.1 non-ribosomal peptide synthetase [Variovorax sp. J2P1-31]